MTDSMSLFEDALERTKELLSRYPELAGYVYTDNLYDSLRLLSWEQWWSDSSKGRGVDTLACQVLTRGVVQVITQPDIPIRHFYSEGVFLYTIVCETDKFRVMRENQSIPDEADVFYNRAKYDSFDWGE